MSTPASGAGAAASRKFEDISPPLPASILEVVRSLGFFGMTPVQAATFPLFRGTKDVCVEACTGSGKTIAYAIPSVERLLRTDRVWAKHEVGALILAPTRELARQIFQVVSLFTANTPLSSVLIIGGTDTYTDIQTCLTKGCNVLVATPGRLVDILRRSKTSSSSAAEQQTNNITNAAAANIIFKFLEVLVLDEADTLLDMGFADAITEILGHLPKQRRTGLFSATQTQEVQALARAGLRNPAIVSVKVKHITPQASTTSSSSSSSSSAATTTTTTKQNASDGGIQSTPLSLSNYYTMCTNQVDKIQQLCSFLGERSNANEKVIVFALTCASVDYYGKIFASPAVRKACGLPTSIETFPILPLHGQMDPKKRIGMYNRFVASKSGVLFCTDVAARGIDVPDVDWIVQFDPPQDPSFYIHRVGRTARAGKKGCAVLFLVPHESSYIELLGVKNVPITQRPRVRANGEKMAGEEGERGSSSCSSSSASSRASAFPSFSSSSSSSFSSSTSSSFPIPTAEADSKHPIVKALQAEAIGDRDVLEKGTRAFVSFVRGYGEHHCKFIFKIDQLNVSSLAYSFGCVKVPKVDEIRGKGKDFIAPGEEGTDTDENKNDNDNEEEEDGKEKKTQENGAEDGEGGNGGGGGAKKRKRGGVSTFAIAYKDPHREAQRQARLKADAEKLAAARAARDARRDKAFRVEDRRAAYAASKAAGPAAGTVAGGVTGLNADGGVNNEEEGEEGDDDDDGSVSNSDTGEHGTSTVGGGNNGSVRGKKKSITGFTTTTNGGVLMRNIDKRKRKHKGFTAKVMEEWEILQAEIRLEKRRKTGKILKQEYRAELIKLHRAQGIEASDDDLDMFVATVDADGDEKGQRQKKKKNQKNDDEEEDDSSDVDDDDDDDGARRGSKNGSKQQQQQQQQQSKKKMKDERAKKKNDDDEDFLAALEESPQQQKHQPQTNGKQQQMQKQSRMGSAVGFPWRQK